MTFYKTLNDVIEANKPGATLDDLAQNWVSPLWRADYVQNHESVMEREIETMSLTIPLIAEEIGMNLGSQVAIAMDIENESLQNAVMAALKTVLTGDMKKDLLKGMIERSTADFDLDFDPTPSVGKTPQRKLM